MRDTKEEHVQSCHEGGIYHQGHINNINYIKENSSRQNSLFNGLDREIQPCTFKLNGHTKEAQVPATKNETGDSNHGGPINFERKLYVYSELEFDLATMLQFLKSFGAIGIEPASTCDRISKALVHFNTKTEVEKVFAIWHSKFSLLFQRKLMFSPTLACQPIKNNFSKVKLIVSGFSKSIDEMDVYDLFRRVGPIFTCSVFYNKWGLGPPCALVQFIDDKLNHQAMVEFNKSHFQEELITVEAFDEYLHWEYDVLNRLPVDPSKVFQVEVSSLPPTYGRRALLNLFRSVGLIIDAKFDAENRRCFISYDCAAECSNATKRFNDYLFEATCLKVQERCKKLETNVYKPPQTSSLPTTLSYNAKHSSWNQKNINEKCNYPSLSINISFDPVNLFSVTCQDPHLPVSITTSATKSGAQLKGHSFLEPCLSDSIATNVIGFKHSISASKDYQSKDTFNPNEFPNKPIQPSSVDGTPSLSQFLDSGMYAIFDGLLERLTPASDSSRQKIAISLFEKAPSNVVKLARDIQELSDKITNESNVILHNQESFLQSPGNEMVL